MLVENLVSSEPNTVVVNFEGKNVVDEWLALGMVFWRVECLEKHLFEESVVSRRIEVLIEGEKWTRELETVA